MRKVIGLSQIFSAYLKKKAGGANLSFGGQSIKNLPESPHFYKGNFLEKFFRLMTLSVCVFKSKSFHRQFAHNMGVTDEFTGT